MSPKRNVSLLTGLRYDGKGPMLAFVLHRVSGLGMVLFVAMHMLASLFGGDAGVWLNTLYEHWLFQIFIFFFALFHAVNGLRIVILDLWPKLIEHQREATWLQWGIFLPLYTIAVMVIIRTATGG